MRDGCDAEKGGNLNQAAGKQVVVFKRPAMDFIKRLAASKLHYRGIKGMWGVVI